MQAANTGLTEAEEGLAGFYQQLDPTETFNPGIGHACNKHSKIIKKQVRVCPVR